MQFGLSESQEILRDSARKFFAGECPIAEVRRLIKTEAAFDAAMWSKLAAQGYTGIIFPEEYAGAGLGVVEMALLMEEAGRVLLPGPFFSTVVLAGTIIHLCGNADQKREYLVPICEGRARATLALLEAEASWDLKNVRMRVDGDKLNGEKLFVTDAAAANYILVMAADGLYVVEGNSPGLTITEMHGMDLTRKLYAMKCENVPGKKLTNTSMLPRALDVATVALVAEMTGGMQRSLDITVEYAKTRKQFGKPIGSFQAVQHQCADMYLDTESSRSAAYYAAWALQENAPDGARAASVAKMYSSDASRTVGNRAIQVHGGMGFTWENDLHLYYRRAKASETMLGDATFHRERIARMVIDEGSAASAA